MLLVRIVRKAAGRALTAERRQVERTRSDERQSGMMQPLSSITWQAHARPVLSPPKIDAQFEDRLLHDHGHGRESIWMDSTRASRFVDIWCVKFRKLHPGGLISALKRVLLLSHFCFEPAFLTKYWMCIRCMQHLLRNSSPTVDVLRTNPWRLHNDKGVVVTDGYLLNRRDSEDADLMAQRSAQGNLSDHTSAYDDIEPHAFRSRGKLTASDAATIYKSIPSIPPTHAKQRGNK